MKDFRHFGIALIAVGVLAAPVHAEVIQLLVEEMLN
jgi:hypothetical protein